jgi:glycosyl hydrolase family 53
MGSLQGHPFRPWPDGRSSFSRRTLLALVVGGAAASAGVGAAAGRDVVGFTVVVDPQRPVDFDRDLAALLTTGASWIRLGVQPWQICSWHPEGWAWDEASLAFFARCIARCRGAGLKISLTLAASVEVAAWSFGQYLDVNRQYWRRCAELAAEGGGVDVLQVYNEHDANDFRSQQPLAGPPSPTYLRDLATALDAARTAVRDLLPRTFVTTTVTGTTVDDATQERWQRFYDVVAPAVDLVSVNCYPGADRRRIADISRRLSHLQDRYGKPVLVAEIGVPTEEGGAVAPEVARTVLPLMIRSAAQGGALAVLVYQLRNTGSDRSQAEQSFGILTADHRRRDTFAAVVDTIGSC